jgi:hypothetical protein
MLEDTPALERVRSLPGMGPILAAVVVCEPSRREASEIGYRRQGEARPSGSERAKLTTSRALPRRKSSAAMPDSALRQAAAAERPTTGS